MHSPLFVRRVVGHSMSPMLEPGRLIIATTFLGKLKAGQVVVLRKNGRELIKRIERVDTGRVYVIGDNPGSSTDSRHFGWLSTDTVVGRVVVPRLTK